MISPENICTNNITQTDQDVVMYLVTYIYTHICVCKNKEKRDHEFETKQEVESTAETLEGGKGMGKL